jgi:TRAP-type mannitol/chloroaromatic compound transport system permease small subunit
VAWLTLTMVLVTVCVVTLRYGFDAGRVWLQESVSWQHAAVFLLAAAWTLQGDGHVRVDIFYREAGARRQAWVNVAGTLLFLIPFCLFFAGVSWDYVAASWSLREGSREAGGLPALYLLKSLLIAMPVLLLLQAIEDLRRDVATLRGAGAGRGSP